MIIIGIIKRLFLLRILKMINQIRIALIIVVVCAMSIDSIAQRGNTAWTKYKHEISVGYGFNTFLASIGANDKIGTRFMLQRSTFNASYRYYLKKHLRSEALSHTLIQGRMIRTLLIQRISICVWITNRQFLS